MTVCSERFMRLGDIERRGLGIPKLPMAVSAHPFGGLQPDAVRAKADGLIEQVVWNLTNHE